MSLIERLFSGTRKGGIVVPERIACEADVNTVYAPVSGEVIPMEQIPDPVFAAGVIGPALGIQPSEGIVYSPVSGEISVTTGTKHALGINSDGGIELLIHLGVDTVEMRGAGFVSYVEKGQRVHAGDALVSMDLAAIAEAGYNDCIITVITNADELPPLDKTEGTELLAGDVLMTLSKE